MQKYRPVTDNTWITIAAKSRLFPVILNGPNRYAADDKKYTASDKTATINRLGPSGSLIKKNTILEQIMAAIANMISEIFFEEK